MNQGLYLYFTNSKPVTISLYILQSHSMCYVSSSLIVSHHEISKFWALFIMLFFISKNKTHWCIWVKPHWWWATTISMCYFPRKCRRVSTTKAYIIHAYCFGSLYKFPYVVTVTWNAFKVIWIDPGAWKRM